MTAHDGIYRLDVETGIYTPIPILSTSTFLAIALDPLDDRVYWSTSYSINSAFPNGSDIIRHYDFDFGNLVLKRQYIFECVLTSEMRRMFVINGMPCHLPFWMLPESLHEQLKCLKQTSSPWPADVEMCSLCGNGVKFATGWQQFLLVMWSYLHVLTIRTFKKQQEKIPLAVYRLLVTKCLVNSLFYF